MIPNEHIESISKLENGHYLLVVNEESRMALSNFAFENGIEYESAFYNTKGWLELFSIKSVELFLASNTNHLSEELCKSILHDAKNLIIDKTDINLVNTKLSLFKQTGEKIPFEKLIELNAWAKEFLNPRHSQETFLPYIFNEIFRILLPYDKREKVSNSVLYKDLENKGEIFNLSLKEQIGAAYKQFYDFSSVCISLSTWPGKLEKKLAQEPELLGNNWGVINEKDNLFLKFLSDWLQSIITKERNPIDDNQLQLSEISKLKANHEILLRASNKLLGIDEKNPSLTIT